MVYSRKVRVNNPKPTCLDVVLVLHSLEVPVVVVVDLQGLEVRGAVL